MLKMCHRAPTDNFRLLREYKITTWYTRVYDMYMTHYEIVATSPAKYDLIK